MINIAEILKDCPKGMELDCAMYEGVTLIHILEGNVFPIKIETPEGQVSLNKYGCYSNNKHAKCIIFPKGKTTWEGFVSPCKFKEGDVIISIYGDIHLLRTEDSSYCAYRYKRNKLDTIITTSITVVRLATEEEKAKLFQVIKDNGYKWNAETKTLEKVIELKFKVGDKIKPIGYDGHYIIKNIKNDRYILNNNNFLKFTDEHIFELVLVEPKFKVGDVIVDINKKHLHCDSGNGKISQITDDKYIFTDGSYIHIQDQDNWELAPNKFDISTLQDFDKVLVRNDNSCVWKCNFYSHYSQYPYHYICIDTGYKQCIPYKGNEHLRGKTDECDDFYRTW